MASTAAMVFFCRLGRMSRRAVLTGFLVGAGAVWAGVVCAGAVCATADAASSNKAGITRAFIFLFSLCGRKHSASERVRATERGRNLQAVHSGRAALGLDGRGARPHTGKTSHTGTLALS